MPSTPNTQSGCWPDGSSGPREVMVCLECGALAAGQPYFNYRANKEVSK